LNARLGEVNLRKEGELKKRKFRGMAVMLKSIGAPARKYGEDFPTRGRDEMGTRKQRALADRASHQRNPKSGLRLAMVKQGGRHGRRSGAISPTGKRAPSGPQGKEARQHHPKIQRRGKGIGPSKTMTTTRTQTNMGTQDAGESCFRKSALMRGGCNP